MLIFLEMGKFRGLIDTRGRNGFGNAVFRVHPFVVENLLESVSFAGVHNQDSTKQVLGFLVFEVLRKIELGF